MNSWVKVSSQHGLFTRSMVDVRLFCLMWEQKPQTALAAAIRTTGICEGWRAATVASRNVDIADGESWNKYCVCRVRAEFQQLMFFYSYRALIWIFKDNIPGLGFSLSLLVVFLFKNFPKKTKSPKLNIGESRPWMPILLDISIQKHCHSKLPQSKLRRITRLAI